MFVLRAKLGRQRRRCHSFGYLSITFEEMDRFHSELIEGQSIIK